MWTYSGVNPVSLIADALRDCSHRQGIIDVGVMRWQRLTGKAAVLEATGQTWDQVRASRLSGADVESGHGL